MVRQVNEVTEENKRAQTEVEFDKVPTDTRKIILARLIGIITVDRDYNIDIHFYVLPDEFEGLSREAS